MAEQHSPIIEFPRKYIGRRVGDPPRDEAIRPETKLSIFIDALRAAGGWIAAILAKCSTMRGRHRIQPKIGANRATTRRCL